MQSHGATKASYLGKRVMPYLMHCGYYHDAQQAAKRVEALPTFF